MRSFVDWVKSPGFNIARGWNLETGTEKGRYDLFPPMDRILAYCLTPREDGKLPFSTVILGRTKKSGKSLDAAAIAAWYADEAPHHSEMYFVANNEKQAADRAFKNLQYDAEQRGDRRILGSEIQFPNGTLAKALPKEPKSVAGGQNDFVAFDEFWGFAGERGDRMFVEMTQSPSSKFPLRVITTYAGYENERPNRLWDLYNLAVINGEVIPELADIVDRTGHPICFRSKEGGVFAMWDTEPRMPWQTDDYYVSEAAILPPAEFLRIHRNQWVSSEDQFIPIEWWDEAVARGERVGLMGTLMLPNTLPMQHFPVCLGVDVGISHDNSAVVGTYYDIKRQRIGLACSMMWAPTKGHPIDLELTVEAYIQDVCKKLKVVTIVYDKTNFHRSMTTLKNKRLPMVEFSQQTASMTKATKALYDALKNGAFEAYPDPQLREHIKYAMAKATEHGYCLSKDKHGRSKFPNDGAVALAMSVVTSISQGGIDTTKKIEIRNPFSDIPDARQFKYQEGEEWLPDPLRQRVRV